MSLTADTCVTADPGVGSLTPVQSRTFVEIDHKMISVAILLQSAESRRLPSVTCESMCTKY